MESFRSLNVNAMETTSRSIYIDPYELERLRLLLLSQGDLKEPGKKALKALSNDLDEAVVVADTREVSKVITMNTRFRLRDSTKDEAEDLQLAFPGRESKGLGKLSVLTPKGAAVLGAREGQTITVSTPEGEKQLVIEEIYAGRRTPKRIEA